MKKIIDAEPVIAKLADRALLAKGRECSLLGEVIDMLRAAPDATDINVGSKWIPVSERLPGVPDGWAENPEPVLYVSKNTGTMRIGYYGENGTYRDRYFREPHDRYEGVDADDVHCWMWQHDLPEAP